MGCGNAVQTAREEITHIKRENDEMRTNLNQLKLRAESSTMQLNREVQKIADLKTNLEVIQTALVMMVKTITEIQKICFGGLISDVEDSIEPEKLAETAISLAEDFQKNALQFASDFESVLRENSNFLPEFPIQSPFFPLIFTVLNTEKSIISQKTLEIHDLEATINHQKQCIFEYRREITELEAVVSSHGLVLSSGVNGSVSYEEEVEICSSRSEASSD